MDADKSGVIEINDIKSKYNGKKHPDVISGKRTEESVLRYVSHCALTIPAAINKREEKKSIDLKYHLYLSESFWIPLILRKRKMARFVPIHLIKEHIFFN